MKGIEIYRVHKISTIHLTVKIKGIIRYTFGIVDRYNFIR